MTEEIKKGRNIAYLRVSTVEQNMARQLDAIRPLNIERCFTDKVSGASKARPGLMELMEYVQEGDTVYVTELSRLARNMIDMCEIAEFFNSKGVVLKSLKENVDLSSPQGVLTMHIFEAMAQFERELIRGRQAEGIAAAKARGQKWGAKQQYGKDDQALNNIMLSFYNGEISKDEAVNMLGSSERTFFRHYFKWLKSMNLEIPDNMKNRKL